MGDILAEQLYTTFVNSGSDVAGSDVPNWASLPSVERERWEQVATKAIRTMSGRFVTSLDTLVTTHGPFDDWSKVVDELGKRWRRP